MQLQHSSASTTLFTNWKTFSKQYHALMTRYAFRYIQCEQQASIIAYKTLRHCWACRKQITSQSDLRNSLRTTAWLHCISILHQQEQLIRSTTITPKTYQQ